MCACCDGNCLSLPLSRRWCAKVWFLICLMCRCRRTLLPFRRNEPPATSQRARWNVEWSWDARTHTLASFFTSAHLPLGTQNTHVSTHRGTLASSTIAAVLNKAQVSVRCSRPVDFQFLSGCLSVLDQVFKLLNMTIIRHHWRHVFFLMLIRDVDL